MAASILVCVVSDVHWPHHHATAYAAWREWHAAVRPYWTICLGDMIDLAAMSRYDKGGDEALPSAEIKLAVRELNAIAKEATRVTFAVGNHQDRFKRLLSGIPAHVLEGLHGLTLRDQMRAHGLSERVEWFIESTATPSLQVAQFRLRHGHRQAGRFGGGVNPASNRVAKSLGVSELFGHHHVAQTTARAAHGRVVQAIANPSMEAMQEYAGSDSTWPLGFTVLEVFPGWQWATAHPVVMDPRGAFAWGGKVYGLRAAQLEHKRLESKRLRDRAKGSKP